MSKRTKKTKRMGGFDEDAEFDYFAKKVMDDYIAFDTRATATDSTSAASLNIDSF